MTFIQSIVKNKIGLMFCSGLFIFVPYYLILFTRSKGLFGSSIQ